MSTDAYRIIILVIKCLSLKATIYAGQFFTQQVVEHYYWLHRKSYAVLKQWGEGTGDVFLSVELVDRSSTAGRPRHTVGVAARWRNCRCAQTA